MGVVWQDIVISTSNLILAMAIPPMVWEGFKDKAGKVPVITSLPTAIALGSISISFFTLDLYWSSILTGLSTLLWTILIIQRIYYANH